MSRTAHFEIGYVAHAHGLQGELELHTHDRASDALGHVKRLLLAKGDAEAREWRVASSRSAARGWLIRLAGITTREAAEALRQSTVSVFRDDLPDIEEAEDEFYQGDLVGLRVDDEQGIHVGLLEAIWNHGPVPTLVIRTTQGEELLLPFADDFVKQVEPKQGKLVVRIPEYVG